MDAAPHSDRPIGTLRAGARASILSILVCAGVSPFAMAQEAQPPLQPESQTRAEPPPVQPDPSGDADLTDESVEEVRDALKQRRNSRVLFPSSGPTIDAALPPSTLAVAEAAGLPALDPGSPRPALLAEGSFIVRRRGVLMVTDWGAHLFAFGPDDSGGRTRPMVVLPCETLRRMESAALATQAAIGAAPLASARVVVIGHFVLTGQVTAYRGRNYISPTAFSLADDHVDGVQAPAEGAARETPPGPARAPEDDPEISDLITDLESLRTTPRSTTPVRETGPEGQDDSLVAEGTAIARRTGRLVRSARGEIAVALDSGVEGREDPPMVLLPCAVTEGLERAANRYGDATTFEFSGRVFAYQGRNYLLPLMYVAESSRNIKPLR